MHEMGIAAEIHRIARHAAAGHGEVRLERVRLAIGELAALEPDLLDFAWTALVDGGPDEGSVLEIDWRQARQSCEACGDVIGRVPGSWLKLCPECGRALRVSGGDELDVLQVVFDETVPVTQGGPS